MNSHNRSAVHPAKKYATWARDALIRGVEDRLGQLGAFPNDDCADHGAQASNGTINGSLPSSQICQLKRYGERHGYDHLVRHIARVWFVRLIAIRYMEVNGLLPHHTRMLSSSDGGSTPDCVVHALDLPLPDLDIQLVSRFIQSGDDSNVFRLVLLAQCKELSEWLPFIFDSTELPYDLALPTRLLGMDEVVGKMVSDIPVDCWLQDVDVFGHLFEGYAEDRKASIRKKTKDAFRIAGDDYAALSQSNTAGWPGHCLVDNSVGRLLYLHSADRKLPDDCKYLVLDNKSPIDGEGAGELSVADPACGSGLLLGYSFDMLMHAYIAQGYSAREATQRIVQSGLHGFDVSELAVLVSKLVIIFKACEFDRRFLRRGIEPRIFLLQSRAFSKEDLSLCSNIAERPGLLDALSHLSECGSLFMPAEDDLAAIRADENELAAEASDGLRSYLRRLYEACEALTAQHDVVVCDAPRVDAKRMSRWLADWMVAHYPNDRLFLPAAFIDRALAMLNPDGFAAVFSSSALLFSGNASAFRKSVLQRVQLECVIETTCASGGKWSSDACWILSGKHGDEPGAFVRLNQHATLKDEALQSIARGESREGLFTRRQSFFGQIPGCPIAYWAPPSIVGPLTEMPPVSKRCRVQGGLSTGNSEWFIRQWYEFSLYDRAWGYHPYANAGFARKWYGNRGTAIRWTNDGEEVKRSFSASSLCANSHFKRGIVWGTGLNFRLLDSDEFMVGNAGILITSKSSELYLLGLLNSSSFELIYKAVNSDANAAGGEIAASPAPFDAAKELNVKQLVGECVDIAKAEYNLAETSWDFCRHPLV